MPVDQQSAGVSLFRLLSLTPCFSLIPVLWTHCHDRWTGSNVCFVMVGGKYPKVEFDINGSLDLVAKE